jgi:hypothetical protein
LNSIFWRLWSLLFPTGVALALALFYIVLPAATCRPHDGGCLALAWAIWIVGCYAFAGVAVALRILRPARAPQHEPDLLQSAADRALGRLVRKGLLVDGRRLELRRRI